MGDPYVVYETYSAVNEVTEPAYRRAKRLHNLLTNIIDAAHARSYNVTGVAGQISSSKYPHGTLQALKSHVIRVLNTLSHIEL